MSKTNLVDAPGFLFILINNLETKISYEEKQTQRTFLK